MDVPTAFRVVRVVFALAARDGRLTEAELAYLDRIKANLGLPTGRDSWSMPIGDVESAAAELHSFPAELQLETLGLLIEAAAVDGVIHETERRFLDAAAHGIGWTAAQLEERILLTLAAAKAPKGGRLGPG